MEFIRTLNVIAEPDVLVCGCGCAGTTAAIAAARSGASTMVVERWGYAGGYITAVVGPSFDGFVDVRTGLPVVGGLTFEFARLAGRASGQVASTRYRPSTELRELRDNSGWTPIKFDMELFKLHADRLLREAGARVLYHTQVADVLREDDRITGVIIVNKGGLSVIKPKMIVDATGDADIAAWAGAPFDIGESWQPMSLHFRVAQVKDISADLKDQAAAALKQAHEAGELGVYGGPWMNEINPGELYINATRYSGDGTDPDDNTAAEIQGREDARRVFDILKKEVPGFKDAYFVSSGPVVGVRESRRIRGDRTLTVDAITQQRVQADVVVKGAWYLDQHPAGRSGYHVHGVTRPYDISYGTLLPQGLANIWVAGRCHSAEVAALASSRVTVTAMGMGQAAGTAAAMAARSGTGSRGLDIAQLQTQLLADDMIILDRADEILAVGDALGDAVPQTGLR